MNNIFTINDEEDYNEKINLDELYERKKQHDILTTNNYNKILSRIHNKIKTTSRLQLKSLCTRDRIDTFLLLEIVHTILSLYTS